MSKGYKKLIKEYNEKYGDIPIEHDEIVEYLEQKLKLTEKDFERINDLNDQVRAIPWNKLQIVLPIIPKPSPRPRLSGDHQHFYVTGAAENKKLFKHYIETEYAIIYTQTHFYLTAYLPTPLSQMNRLDVYRAETKQIAAASNPDFDNLLKTYSDMIQGRLLFNDNLITIGHCEKYFSVKPRIEINIQYQLGYDSKYNKRRIEKQKAFIDAVETGHIIEIYTDDYDQYLVS